MSQPQTPPDQIIPRLVTLYTPEVELRDASSRMSSNVTIAFKTSLKTSPPFQPSKHLAGARTSKKKTEEEKEDLRNRVRIMMKGVRAAGKELAKEMKLTREHGEKMEVEKQRATKGKGRVKKGQVERKRYKTNSFRTKFFTVLRLTFVRDVRGRFCK